MYHSTIVKVSHLSFSDIVTIILPKKRRIPIVQSLPCYLFLNSRFTIYKVTQTRLNGRGLNSARVPLASNSCLIKLNKMIPESDLILFSIRVCNNQRYVVNYNVKHFATKTRNVFISFNRNNNFNFQYLNRIFYFLNVIIILFYGACARIF